MKSIKHVLLIDDDKFTSFYNEKIVKKHSNYNILDSVNSGKAALEYLQKSIKGSAQVPDVIFLDINMPSMNGWEFIEEFRKLDVNFTESIEIIMLTTSSNPSDKEKADKSNEISHFINKPLSLSLLDELLVYQ
ncbi:response regulator [Flavobacteriaceae bacterium MHTCC 0001]